MQNIVKTTSESFTTTSDGTITSTLAKTNTLVSYTFGSYLLFPFTSAGNYYWRFVVADLISGEIIPQANVSSTLTLKYIE